MLMAQQITPTSVNPGGNVRIWGKGFDSKCKVVAGGSYLPVLDYDAEGIEFSAPYECYRYEVVVERLAETTESFFLCVEHLKDSQTWNLPARGREEFRAASLGMMPRGFAWYLGKEGNWWKLFTAFADGLKSIYDMLRLLVAESSPVTTTAFVLWEKELGLPVNGSKQYSDEDRLSEIYRVARKRGGSTVTYFQGLLNIFGRDAKIYEYWKNPEKFDDVDLGDDDPNFCWMIEQIASDEDWFVCTCDDTCEDYLECWWNVVVESFIDLVKPAHTKVVYTYAMPEIVRVITENEGDCVMTEDGDYITTENGVAV